MQIRNTGSPKPVQRVLVPPINGACFFSKWHKLRSGYSTVVGFFLKWFQNQCHFCLVTPDFSEGTGSMQYVYSAAALGLFISHLSWYCMPAIGSSRDPEAWRGIHCKFSPYMISIIQRQALTTPSRTTSTLGANRITNRKHGFLSIGPFHVDYQTSSLTSFPRFFCPILLLDKIHRHIKVGSKGQFNSFLRWRTFREFLWSPFTARRSFPCFPRSRFEI